MSCENCTCLDFEETPAAIVPFHYPTEAQKTLKSERFYPEKISNREFLDALDNFVAAADMLDKFKRSMFYGTEFPAMPMTVERDITISEVAPNLIHGIVGAASESGELISALLKALRGGGLDRVNVCEEIGDTEWYFAVLYNELNTTMDAVQRANIAKLRFRRPQDFDIHDVGERNRVEERRILEEILAPKP
jgi:hypothetical protein